VQVGSGTYTVVGDRLTQTAKDESSDPRRDAYDGVTYTRATAALHEHGFGTRGLHRVGQVIPRVTELIEPLTTDN
jgi:hypothetical protein